MWFHWRMAQILALLVAFVHVQNSRAPCAQLLYTSLIVFLRSAASKRPFRCQAMSDVGHKRCPRPCMAPFPIPLYRCPPKHCLIQCTLREHRCDRQCSSGSTRGQMHRPVSCHFIDGTVQQRTYKCPPLEEVSAKECNTQECLTFAWKPSAWSPCSGVCSGGGKRRCNI